MRRFFATLAALFACAAAQPALAAEADDALATLIAQDLRLARIAQPIIAANAALCGETMPATGMVLHSADQYSARVSAGRFSQGRVVIAAIVPGSPADRAGLRAGDALVQVNGSTISDLPPPVDAPLRDAAFELLAHQLTSAPLRILIGRDGERRDANLAVGPGCRALIEITTGSGLIGRSDGRVIQISYELAALLDDDGLAVIFAHELAHAVLRHRERLVAAGVSKGLLGEFGRNQQLNRQVEVEAERLSAHLLANAGHDPAIAPAFWNSAAGQRAGGGVLRSFIYPAPTSRGDLIAREIARYLPLGRGPTWPGHLLALRERPF